MTSNTTTPGGLEARPPAARPDRTPAEIAAEIERTRARLAGTVDAIAERVKPANVARRGVDALRELSANRHRELRDEEPTRPRAREPGVAGARPGLIDGHAGAVVNALHRVPPRGESRRCST